MATPNSTIFRTEALQYRLHHQGRCQADVTFPRWMTRRVLIALWIVLGFLGIGGVAACLVPVPVSGSGLAIVMPHSTQSADATSVAVLMPQQYGPHLKTGANAKVFSGTSDRAINGTVTRIDPAPLDSAAAEQRLGLPASSLAMLGGPVVLVGVNVDSATTGLLAPGTTGRAELPVGSRHAGAFLPLVGRLFRSAA